MVDDLLHHHRAICADWCAYHDKFLQVLLRWNIQNDVVVIPKSTKPHRIEENAGIWDWELTEEEMNRLGSLKKQVRSYNCP